MGDDLFVGDNNTLTADVINGLEGIDTLQVTTANTAAAYTAVPSMSNVDIVKVSALGTAGATINFANVSGVTTLVSSAGSDALTFTAVKAIAAVEINSTTAGAQTVTYAAAAVSGTADVQNLSLTSATTGAVAFNGVETVAVTAASGSSKLASLASTTLSKVTIAGAGDLTISAALAGATTIDASTATGTIKVEADAAKAVAFTGGKGADTINMVAGLTSADTLNGGDGTDTLRLSTQATYTTAAATNVTNFEALQIDAASTATIDLSLYGATDVFKTITLGNGSETLGLVAGQVVAITKGVTGSTVNVDLNAATTGTLSYALATDGSADALTLNLRNTDTDSGTVVAETIATFTASTIEDLTITANKAVVSGTTFESDSLGIATISAAAATSLTLSGNLANAIGGTASTFTALASVVAGAATGDVTLGAVGTAFNTSVTGAVITTGSGNDLVSLNVGAAGVLKAVDLGANTGAAGADTLALASTAGTGLTIIDLSSTTDQISQLLGSANAAAQLNIENINLAGFAAGGATSQITGSSGANVIVGGAGVDTISAGAGNDTITGGANADILTGGAGSNTFVYTTAADSNAVTAAVMDTITGLVLNGAAGDIIKVAAVTVAATSASGAANIAAADTTAELEGLYKTAGTAGTKFGGAGAVTALLATNLDGSQQLVIDVNGDGAFTAADVAIIVTGVTATSFAATNFIA